MRFPPRLQLEGGLDVWARRLDDSLCFLTKDAAFQLQRGRCGFFVGSLLIRNGRHPTAVQVKMSALRVVTDHFYHDVFLFFLFYLPYLSSIHEKANCIAILWTVSPHSLGSCLFRGLWVTCLPHKGGGVPLSALPKDTTSELAGLFSTTSPKCRAPSRKAVDAIF